MRVNSAAVSPLLVSTLCLLARQAVAQPEVGAAELARAKTLLDLSRAGLSAEELALLSGRLGEAEAAYAELTTIARASHAAVTLAEGGSAAAGAEATGTAGRALLGGAADLIPLLLLLWPATAHAPEVKQETPEVRAARLKVEEKLKAVAEAAQRIQSERAAAEQRMAAMIRKRHKDPAPDTVPSSWIYPEGQRPCDLIGTGGSGLFKPGGIPDWVRCDYICGTVPQARKFWGNSKDVCLDPANRPTY